MMAYNGFPLRFVCDNPEDVTSAVQQINSVANALAETNKVYWRRPIEIVKETYFDTESVRTIVSARLSFSKEDTPYGLFKIDRAYDNDHLLTGFGLSDYNSSK